MAERNGERSQVSVDGPEVIAASQVRLSSRVPALGQRGVVWRGLRRVVGLVAIPIRSLRSQSCVDTATTATTS